MNDNELQNIMTQNLDEELEEFSNKVKRAMKVSPDDLLNMKSDYKPVNNLLELEKYSDNISDSAIDNAFMKTFDIEDVPGTRMETHNKIQSKEYYHQPGIREKQLERQKEYNLLPEVRERKKEYSREYYSRPEVKEKTKERIKEYRSLPEVKEKLKEYRMRPYVRERMNEYSRQYSKTPEFKQREKEKYEKQKKIDMFLIKDAPDKTFLNEAFKIAENPINDPFPSQTRKILTRKREIQEELDRYDPFIRNEYLKNLNKPVQIKKNKKTKKSFISRRI